MDVTNAILRRGRMSNVRLNSRRFSGGPPTLGGKIGGTIVLLIFFAFGAGFFGLIAADLLKTAGQRLWPGVDCVITHSSVLDNKVPSAPNYRLKVAFRYSFQGRDHSGNLLSANYSGSDDYYKAEKLVDAYPVGSHWLCYVDPEQPSRAVLRKDSLAVGFFLVIPLVFILVGGGGIFLIWKPRPAAAEGVATGRRGELGKNGTRVLFSIFFLAGALVLGFIFLPLMVKVSKARAWPAVACTIVHSGVSSHSGSKGGTTYAVEVLYRYQLNGKKYLSSRYEFLTGSSSGRDSKQDIVQTLAAGKKTVCYVDPADPEYAVLNRGFSWAMLSGLIPLLFMIVGAAGLSGRIRGLGNKPVAADGGPVNKSVPSRLGVVLGSMVMAGFWNGIVAVFINECISDWTHHHPDYFLAVFLIPFVLIGVGLIINAGYQIVMSFKKLRTV